MRGSRRSRWRAAAASAYHAAMKASRVFRPAGCALAVLGGALVGLGSGGCGPASHAHPGPLPTTHPETKPVAIAVAKPEPAPIQAGQARITVVCDFNEAWAAVVPKGVVDPSRDEFA